MTRSYLFFWGEERLVVFMLYAKTQYVPERDIRSTTGDEVKVAVQSLLPSSSCARAVQCSLMNFLEKYCLFVILIQNHWKKPWKPKEKQTWDQRVGIKTFFSSTLRNCSLKKKMLSLFAHVFSSHSAQWNTYTQKEINHNKSSGLLICSL